MHRTKSLKFLQVNTESIKSNKELISNYITEENIDIGIFCETWCKNTDNIKFPNYNLFLNNRPDGYGGVGVLVKDIFHSSTLLLNNYLPIEAILVEISHQNFSIKVISIYIPPNIDSKRAEEKFQSLLNDFENEQHLIIAGDINAHNYLWESHSHQDTRGRLLSDIITNSKLIIQNNGDHTYQDTFRHSTTAIDITLTSANMMTNWNVNKIKLGSRHFPIIFEIENYKISKHIYRQVTNWEEVQKQIQFSNLQHTNNISEFQNTISEIMSKNSKLIKTKSIPKPWWNDTIKRLWLVKKYKQTIYNHNKNNYTAIELKKSVCKLKMAIKKSKQECWKSFIENISPDHSSQEIWNNINKFKGKHKASNTFFTLNNNMTEFLKTNFENQTDNINRNIQAEVLSSEDYFHSNEISRIIKNNKNTAPGIDNVSNKVLKFLSSEQIETLTKHMNNIWKKQEFPAEWRRIKIIAIPKPNKNLNNISGYRPIYLLPVLLKIFNKLIKIRLNKFIEKNKLIPKNSYGFRKQKCTMDVLVRVVNKIEKNKKNKQNSIMLLIDAEKAFDNVKINLLFEQLEKIKIPRAYINWIKQFLMDRELSMSAENVSKSITTSKGLPQGSVLSPILFNLYTASLHHTEKENSTEIFQYADDFTIIVSDKNFQKLFNKTNKILLNFNQNLNKINLLINASKCSYMIFGKQKLQNETVKLNGSIIEKVNVVKLLGITIDNRLTFNKHFEILNQKNNTFLNILKIFTKAMGGAHPKTMITVYKSIFKSRYNYSLPLTPINSKTQNKKIQTMYNKGLRICLGLTNSTPVTAVIAECGELPAHLDNELITLKYICRQLYYNSEIGKQIRSNNTIEKFQQLFNKYESLQQIPKLSKVDYKLKNLKVYSDFSNHKDANNNYISKEFCELMNKYKHHTRIFTDGSKVQNSGGIGIFLDNKNLPVSEISKCIKENISIKSIEIIAIHLAIQLAVQLKLSKVIILTDSKSSCTSIQKTFKEQNNKHYENEIILLAQANPETDIIIQWIPAHKGIMGNEIADLLAKQGSENQNQLEIKIPIEEMNTIIKKKLYNEWEIEFQQLTLNKGTYHKNIIQNISMKPWFQTSTLNSKNIKTISRLRTGHAFNKKYLHMIGKEHSPYCLVCNEIENNLHIIKNCQIYDNIRNKYQLLTNKNLDQILIEKNDNELIQICDFLKEIKYNL